jgi:sulfide:quinone oxidoreductase
MDILIAGGGIAGLEALLALHAMAGDRVRLTLVAPDPDFTYRPLAVAEPFSAGHPYRVPLEQLAEATGAELVLDAVVAVDDAAGTVQLSGGGTLAFDALLVAPGGRAVAGLEGASTWWPGGDPDHYGGLLRDVEEGYAKRLAVVVPAGAVWPLPAYELALMTAGEARAMGQDDVEVIVVTPERMPLAVFGPEASAAVAEELRAAGVGLRTGVVGFVEPGGLRLEPGGEHLELQRVFAVPRVVGPGLEGLPADVDGFILARDDARVEGCERIWAAGDGVVSPVKFGGLATHQARRAAAAIARSAGVESVPDPGEPVLHGRLLVGRRSRRLRARRGAPGAPLWWPGGKVAGEYLPRWLSQQGIAPAPAAAEPGEGVTVRRPLRAMSPEAQYVYELARQYGRRTAAVASLGGRGRPDHES